MRASKRIFGLGVAFVGMSMSACGIEGLINGGFTGANELEVVTVSGTFSNNASAVTLVNSDGAVIEPLEQTVGGGQFELQLEPSGELANVIAVATEGEKLLWLLIPRVPGEGELTGLTIDVNTTAAFLVVGGALAPQGRDRKTLDPNVARVALEDAQSGFTDTATGTDFLAWVQAAIDAADGSATVSGVDAGPFQLPVLDASYGVETSALRDEWWTANSGNVSFTREAFDGALATSASVLNLIGCVDPDVIRVVFEADLGPDRVSPVGFQCVTTNGFAFGSKDFVQPDPGDAMFFTGSLHPDSLIPSASSERIPIDNLLGQFDPGAVPMFDDGTNGDEVAGDNIWTVTFDLPRGAFIQYKYTWGIPNEPWTGTEEWPGNERLLEIADVNGDNFVRRRDAFGDEATNKSIANECCGLAGLGNRLEFDPAEDRTGNGYVETREQPLDGAPVPVDRRYDCSVDESDWVTPVGIGPVLIDCPTE